jgi:glycosyltransferase involved in cell wall biosynthesis
MSSVPTDDRPTARVSVIVLVFNHAKYLRRTLAGIEMQDFGGGLEVVIHDDASTDESEAVYSEFASRSRHRYKIIRQPDNKYSKNVCVYPEIFAACSGAYLAFCEGDDYWTSPQKISTQHMAMDVRADVDVCFHKATRVHFDSEASLGFQADYGDKPLLLPASTVIEGGGGFMPSASLMFRRKLIDQLPDWFFKPPPVTDYFLQVFGSLRGGALYLPMCASAYRQGDPQSWTHKVTRDLRTLNDFSLNYYSYLRRLQLTVPEHLRGNVEVMLKKVYTEYCSRCFDLKNFEDIPRLIALIHAAGNDLTNEPRPAALAATSAS